ncbi:adenosylcobinamide-GDP ribazoletransferase [Paenibacillus aurantius]|uniref:Adenosylcobinamide-GDP ribazoletransferase n=1 Tax=Paenibacillus aurantius TaxID=2918900 RepID=A0AA96RGN2_9BACL|nr:adenosylcobinamide-GDP ribazoletransferase [Paenibacillus aurantius]WNQ10229.1 adenosylcobinamide-GDP ribazoletransferase [Paenibacillus aurantius]
MRAHTVREQLTGGVRSLAAAFQFLTRFPVPYSFEYTERIFRGSTVFYPMAGAAIGFVLYAGGLWLPSVLPGLPAAALLLALWVALTGALHLDGLMDTADGVLSGRPREQMLDIMKDSRVGAMGVLVCVIAMLLKFALLDSLLGQWAAGGSFLLFIPVWSRWFMTAAIAGWPYARPGPGLGAYFRGVGPRHAAGGWLLAGFLTVSAALLTGSSWTGAVGLFGTFTIGTAAAGWAGAAYLNRKLGGLTGDTYGALNEGIELIGLLAVIIWLKIG